MPRGIMSAITRTFCCAGVAIAALAIAAARPYGQQPSTAFVGVSVLTMENNAVVADQTVIVSQGKIVSVAPASNAQERPLAVEGRHRQAAG